MIQVSLVIMIVLRAVNQFMVQPTSSLSMYVSRSMEISRVENNSSISLVCLRNCTTTLTVENLIIENVNTFTQNALRDSTV